MTLAVTMAVTQDDVDALNQAIADGVRSVTVGGQTTLYNTTDSLIKARDDLQRQLTLQTARETGRRVSRRTMLHYAGREYQS